MTRYAALTLIAALALPAHARCRSYDSAIMKLTAVTDRVPGATLHELHGRVVARLVREINLLPPVSNYAADTIITLSAPTKSKVFIMLSLHNHACHFITMTRDLWTAFVSIAHLPESN